MGIGVKQIGQYSKTLDYVYLPTTKIALDVEGSLPALHTENGVDVAFGHSVGGGG